MQNYSPLLSLPLVAHDTDVLKLSVMRSAQRYLLWIPEKQVALMASLQVSLRLYCFPRSSHLRHTDHHCRAETTIRGDAVLLLKEKPATVITLAYTTHLDNPAFSKLSKDFVASIYRFV